jgi:hypothetical protein
MLIEHAGAMTGETDKTPKPSVSCAASGDLNDELEIADAERAGRNLTGSYRIYGNSGPVGCSISWRENNRSPFQ